MNQPRIPLLDARRPLVQVTASRNLARATDNQCHLFNSGSTQLTLTIVQNTFQASDEVDLACPGTGTMPITPGTGTTLNGGTTTITIAAGKGATLKFYAANAAWLFGGV